MIAPKRYNKQSAQLVRDLFKCLWVLSLIVEMEFHMSASRNDLYSSKDCHCVGGAWRNRLKSQKCELCRSSDYLMSLEQLCRAIFAKTWLHLTDRRFSLSSTPQILIFENLMLQSPRNDRLVFFPSNTLYSAPGSLVNLFNSRFFTSKISFELALHLTDQTLYPLKKHWCAYK